MKIFTNKQPSKSAYPMVVFVVCLFLGSTFNVCAQSESIGFTQADRDRIIQTQTELAGLRSEMNARFEAVDKRFEAADKRFDDFHSYLGWIIALFGGMFAATVGFAMWDRRTMIRPFETKVKQIDIAIDELKNETKATKIMTALRELAKTDTKLAEILKNNNLL